MQSYQQTPLNSAAEHVWAVRERIMPEVSSFFAVPENAGCSSGASRAAVVNEVSDTLLTRKSRQRSTTTTCRPNDHYSKSGSRLHRLFLLPRGSKLSSWQSLCLPHTDSCFNTDEGLVSFTHTPRMHHATCQTTPSVCVCPPLHKYPSAVPSVMSAVQNVSVLWSS